MIEHTHILDGDLEYCVLIGKYIQPGKWLTPQELKEKWRGKKE